MWSLPPFPPIRHIPPILGGDLFAPPVENIIMDFSGIWVVIRIEPQISYISLYGAMPSKSVSKCRYFGHIWVYPPLGWCMWPPGEKLFFIISSIIPIPTHVFNMRSLQPPWLKIPHHSPYYPSYRLKRSLGPKRLKSIMTNRVVSFALQVSRNSKRD